VSESIKIRTSADIEAIEKRGFEAYLSSNTPFGLIEDTARARPGALSSIARSSSHHRCELHGPDTIYFCVRGVSRATASGAKRTLAETTRSEKCR